MIINHKDQKITFHRKENVFTITVKDVKINKEYSIQLLLDDDNSDEVGHWFIKESILLNSEKQK